MKLHDINEIKADYWERWSVLSILLGLQGTYRGMMTNWKYDKMKAQLDKMTSLVNCIVNVVNNPKQVLRLTILSSIIKMVWVQLISDLVRLSIRRRKHYSK